MIKTLKPFWETNTNPITGFIVTKEYNKKEYNKTYNKERKRQNTN